MIAVCFWLIFPFIYSRDKQFNKILPTLPEGEREKYFSMSNSQKQDYKNYIINKYKE